LILGFAVPVIVSQATLKRRLKEKSHSGRSFLGNVIDCPINSGLPRTVRAAEIIVRRFYPVSDHLAPAMGANGREFVNRTFETIESVLAASCHYPERKVIVVPANIAFGHNFLLLLWGIEIRPLRNPGL
jgi:hypothetical protein